jgi:hypothetical protein
MSSSSSPASGKETEKKVPLTRTKTKARTQGQPVDIKCMFCWFIHEVYPDLTNMRPRDAAAFQEHLVKAHGLRQEISA